MVVAVKVSRAVPVAVGVADRDGTFQPFGMCGWTTMPTATSFPWVRLAGAMIVTKEPAVRVFARAAGNIFTVDASVYWCWVPL